MLDKQGIAKRIAKEVKDGYYVNLGIGIPTLVANFVREDISVEFQSEMLILLMQANKPLRPWQELHFLILRLVFQ